jgi:O-antigen ligase
MVRYKQGMKVNNIDMVFISFLALVIFLAGWYIFGLFIAVVISLLVVVVGVVRMRHTRSVERLNSKKGLYQRTLFKK